MPSNASSNYHLRHHLSHIAPSQQLSQKIAGPHLMCFMAVREVTVTRLRFPRLTQVFKGDQSRKCEMDRRRLTFRYRFEKSEIQQQGRYSVSRYDSYSL